MSATRLAGVIAIAFALAACAGDGDEEPEPAASATAGTQPTTSAPAPPKLEGTAPTPASLAGTWTLFGERLLWRFTADGAFAFDRADPGTPFASGTYEVEGQTITFEAKGPGCSDTWTWEAAIEDGDAKDPLDDELKIVFATPGCDRIARTQWTFGRLAPG